MTWMSLGSTKQRSASGAIISASRKKAVAQPNDDDARIAP